MFRYGLRVSPIRVFGGLAIAFVVFNAIGGAVAAGIGAMLILPLVMFKLFLMLMMFRFVMGFVGGREGYAQRGPWTRASKRDEEVTPEEAELRDYVRKAREHLDELYPQA